MDDEDRKFVNKFLDEDKQIKPRKVVDIKEADVIEVDRDYVKELMDTYLLWEVEIVNTIWYNINIK